MREIRVDLQHDSYSILIEKGLLRNAGEHVRPVAPHARCMLIADARIAHSHGEAMAQALKSAGYQVQQVELHASENEKSPSSLDRLYAAMLEAGHERESPVIAVGGGIVMDLVGYAAATFMRGVPLVNVPTTLLGMVDASIGGKNGINFPQPVGKAVVKNLIGTIWQPRVVLIDPSVLATLDARDFRCGIAECVKHAMVADASLLAWMGEHAAEILSLDDACLLQLIERCAAIKATIVAADEREKGRRFALNLGHTFAHAIESMPELDCRHGEAVAIGLCCACHIACATGRMKPDERQMIQATLVRFGLPTRLSAAIPAEGLEHAMRFDKKVRDGRLRLVLPRGIGAVELADDVPASLVREAWIAAGAPS